MAFLLSCDGILVKCVFSKQHEKHCPKIICRKQKLFSRHDKNRLKRMNSEQKSMINEEFQEILDKCNDKTRIKLDKYFDYLIEAKNEQTKLVIENQHLESEIENINNESIILKHKLSEKNFEINLCIAKTSKLGER